MYLVCANMPMLHTTY